MKTFAILAAAGSLAAFSAPVAAADIAPPAAPAAAYDVAAFTGLASGIVQPASYDRDPPRHARAWGRRGGRDWDDRWDDDRWDDDDDWRERRWRDRDRWRDGRRLGRRDRIWRGRDGRFRCRRDDGTVGLVIGAGVGALLGREIDRRGDRTLGTVLGAVAGGLLGREIDRGDVRCR
ncbi:glycine zipper 2TM domain-containing protein [Erythrobacter sp.]|uniref:glycine zipper 2TM domain-containing protein n=1 Tax=Erythrobacter sp. TaxID=1042 RepID=UPI001425F443|nr:glycine zipper 2TM domain-containing protein [Erythrobacter sp.]QIQ85805.1 MAG: glycine zipper 2TM domain-containing protein [Erythrobacter sp.]